MYTMENTEGYVHCRLCAEVRLIDSVYNLDTEEKKSSEILTKLSFLNVDVSINNSQYTTVICLICYDSLNRAYEFLSKVKKAQAFYWKVYKDNQVPIISTSDVPKNKSSADDICPTPTFEEILASQDIQNEQQNIPNSKIEVKLEEVNSSDTEHLKEHHSIQYIEQDSISVQEIIDAALNTTPFKTEDNIEIYAKEMPMLPKTGKRNKTELRTYKTKPKTPKIRNDKIKLNGPDSVPEDSISKMSIKQEVSWTNYPWVCAYCMIEFHSLEMLREHAKMIHGKCGAFTCIDCKYYGQKDDFMGFIKHVRKHREELRDRCHYCDCEVKRTLLHTHVAEHFPNPSLTCRSCGEVIPDVDTFRQHLDSFMTEPRKKRRKPNTPVTEADLTCTICKNVYKTRNGLRDHMKNQHNKDRRKDYTCDRCGKMFYMKGTLTSHLIKHDDKKPHACKICNKTFVFQNLLRRHVQSHSGIKPFLCASCPKRFRLRQQLANHSVVHSDHMPYRCQYCTKEFRFQSILKNHERQHTGAKPYECKHCAMQFTCWSNYNKHMKRRHNTDMSRKKITAQGTLPVDPATGQVIQIPQLSGLEEWKSQVMQPCKRGKKPAAKPQSSETV